MGPMPIYITVGPPCCGKTTFLSRQNKQQGVADIQDVSLDDQPGVYLALPTHYFLPQKEPSKTEHNNNRQTVLNKVWFGKRLGDRIQQDNVELSLVIQRCAGHLTASEFANALSRHYAPGEEEANSTQQSLLVACAIRAYEGVWSSKQQQPPMSPPTTDLFAVQAIFQPNPQTNASALDATCDLLFSSPPDQPLAWGNTNTKASDYRVALEVAQSQGRPVHFVVYNALQDSLADLNDNNDNDSNSTQPAIQMETELESVGLDGLLQRNLLRYIQTGRYIHVGVIWDMVQRTNSLLTTVWEEHLKQRGPQPASGTRTLTKKERDGILVRLAGMEMLENRTLAPVRTTRPRRRALSPPSSQQQQQRPANHHGAPKRRFQDAHGTEDKARGRNNPGNNP